MNDLGSLNVNTGVIGKSPNEIAAEAAEAANKSKNTGIAAIRSVQKDPVSDALVGQFGRGNSAVPGNPVMNTDPDSGALVGQFGSGNPGFYTDPNSGALIGQFGRGYAEGGAVEQGMEAALARNGGISYNLPAPIAGAADSISNFNDLGSLNVNTGEIGQSPNEIAAEAAKPKYTTPASGTNVGGGAPSGGNSGFTVPTKFVMGMGTVPADYTSGILNPYYRDIAGNYIRRAKGGPIPAAYAEGGAVEQGMAAALARNGGVASITPAPIEGAADSSSNMNDLGSLNVNTGVIGKSPNEIAAEAAEAANKSKNTGIAAIRSVQKDPVSDALVGQFGRGNSAVPGNPVMNTDPDSGALVGQFGSGNPGFYTDPNSGALIGQFGRGYAEGGAVEQGMEAALARNGGISYNLPAPASSVNTGGISNFNDLGSLNVNLGTIGQSPNAVAAAARLKAIEDAKPVYQGFSVTQQQGPTLGDILGTTGPGPKNYAPTPYDIIFGGQQGFAEGGYLGGGDINVQGDGMSDDIPASIDNEQPAALSEGEFVIPADVVSHIGNGSSEAGAKEFYGMMDRVRMARTGRKKQSPEINPQRFMPA